MQPYHMRGACSLADLIVLGWLGVQHEIVPMTLDSIKSPDYRRSIRAGTYRCSCTTPSP